MTTAATRRDPRLGWRPDLTDQRDHRFSAIRHEVAPKVLPERTDLRRSHFMPPVEDQGDLGSCTSFGAACCFEFATRHLHHADYVPSHLFVYYAERTLDGTVPYDAGSTIRQSMKALASVGAPHEALWPYDVRKFAQHPPQAAYEDAAKHRAIEYLAVDHTQDAIKAALAAHFPVTFGFTVYESFMSDAVARSGLMPMPQPSEAVEGGHCVCIVGYTAAHVICRNSWSAEWGRKGYFLMPWSYLLSDNCDDFWTVRAVSPDAPNAPTT